MNAANLRVGIPTVDPMPVLAIPDVTDTTTSQGVRVIAVRLPSVPLVQIQLLVPFDRLAQRDLVVLRILPQMYLAGTGRRTGSEVTSTLRRLGMFASADADIDYLTVSATIPNETLGDALTQLVDIIAHPSFPQREVVGERERVVQEVLQEAVDPIALATRALAARLYPRHPYADPLPETGAVRRVGRSRLVRFHDDHVRPRGCLIVAVGDIDPVEFTARLEESLGQWDAPRSVTSSDSDLAKGPEPAPAVSAITVVHRPGAVQSNLRLGTRCPDRHDPAFAALFLASTVLGGHFTSRLFENLRERHGYTYSVRAAVEEHRLATSFACKAEVGTEVTAPALVEINYELARMATTLASEEELDTARRFVTGVLAMAAATQAGLAGLLGGLLAQGLEPLYLERFTRQLADVDVATIADAAAKFLGPSAMTIVVVGDARVVAQKLRPLGDVTVVADEPLQPRSSRVHAGGRGFESP